MIKCLIKLKQNINTKQWIHTLILIGLKSILKLIISHVITSIYRFSSWTERNGNELNWTVGIYTYMYRTSVMPEERFSHWNFPTIWTIISFGYIFGHKIKQIIWCCTDYIQQMSAKHFSMSYKICSANDNGKYALPI